MGSKMVIITIITAAACTLLLRVFPFIFFHGNRRLPKWLDSLGKILPGTIIAVLVVYCLKDMGDDWIHRGIPELVGVLVTAATYKWKHNTLISIVSGTASYMALINIL